MTDRLYYNDSFLYEFDADIGEAIESPRPALVLDRTAFYPTSGGQLHDTGWISTVGDSGAKLRMQVTEVVDREDGRVVHYLEAPLKNVQAGSKVRGEIDADRRRDHMQQHSAQHVLSAAFVRLFGMPTVSFHMAADYCSIDLETDSLTKEQVEAAEKRANEIMIENRTVDVRYASRAEAAELGLRKLPPSGRDQLRLIDIREVDLSACGGTHVSQTGQIGGILLRKFEKVRQGYRVEFVAGQRAVAIARRDFTTLTEAATLFSSHIWDVPQQVRKSLDEIRTLRKQLEQAQMEKAEGEAAAVLAATPADNGRKVIVRTFADRDLNSVKLLAQMITRQSNAVIAFLASTSPQPSVVFAQSAGQPYDMGALIKQTLAKLGGRGGGSKDLAQGGAPRADGLDAAIAAAAQLVGADPVVKKNV